MHIILSQDNYIGYFIILSLIIKNLKYILFKQENWTICYKYTIYLRKSTNHLLNNLRLSSSTKNYMLKDMIC